MAEDYVADDEALYRSVRGNPEADEYQYVSGKLLITRHAFKDSKKSPSVDRAILLENNPIKAQKSASDGIVSLIAKDVREIGDVHTRTNDDEKTLHSVDVIPDPIKENPAHALVTVDPEFFGSNNKQKNAFKLLRIALARLATQNGWTVEPNSQPSS